jgi:DNA polymerase-3 subunit gamma/tau
MRDQAVRVGPATLARYAEVVHAGLGEMRGATAPRLLLEVVCARLLLPSASDTESALLQRIERIETRMDISIPAAEAALSAETTAPVKQYARKTQPAAPASVAAPEPEPVAKPEPVAEPEPVASTASGEPGAAAVRSMWSTVRDKVRQRSRTTEVMLAGAIVRAVEDDTLVLAHESGPLAKRLSEQRNADVIRDALKDALGVDWRVRCEVGAGQPMPAPDPVETQRAEEDSMIAEVGRDEDAAPRRDPEEIALELLQSELGARRIDG